MHVLLAFCLGMVCGFAFRGLEVRGLRAAKAAVEAKLAALKKKL